MAKITWTHTDEAPALATMAFLPVLKTFSKGTDVGQLHDNCIGLLCHIT
jgi:isocitrate dehydrogenase